MDKSMELIRSMKRDIADMKNIIADLLDCDGCRKGPCIGRIQSGETRFSHESALFIHDGRFYLEGCSMARKTDSDSSIAISNVDGKMEVSTPTLLVRVRDSVNSKDIPVGR
ncbi:MAG: hypothetical protein ACWGQW_01700 [bacterium]